MRNSYQSISTHRARALLAANGRAVAVDVREPHQRRGGSVPRSVAIPASQLGWLAPRLLPDLDRPLLVYCQTGAHSWESAQLLCQMGYNQVYDMGGYLDWRMT